MAIVHVCAIAILSYLFYLFPPSSVAWGDMGFWLVFGLATHAVQFRAAVFRNQSIRVSVGFAASTAMIALFPPSVSMVLISLSSISWGDVAGKNLWYKIAFNRSMFLFCGGIAATVFTVIRGFGDPADVTWTIGSNLVAGLVYFVTNFLLLATVVALASGRPVQRILSSTYSTSTLVSYLTLATFGSALALIYIRVSPLAVLFFGIPLIAFYYALQNSARVRRFYSQLIQSLSESLDLREHETAGHTRRIAVLAQHLGRMLGLDSNALESVYVAGLMHDLGKIGMPDHVLLKPEQLTDEEWAIARRHPVEGARLLEPYEHLQGVAQIVRHHHERYDGSGYPDGLKGEAIPLGARIVSVVDAFDAMYFGRPYRSARSWEDVREEVYRSRGSQFDPKVAEAFLSLDWPGVLEQLLAEDQARAHE